MSGFKLSGSGSANPSPTTFRLTSGKDIALARLSGAAETALGGIASPTEGQTAGPDEIPPPPPRRLPGPGAADPGNDPGQPRVPSRTDHRGADRGRPGRAASLILASGAAGVRLTAEGITEAIRLAEAGALARAEVAQTPRQSGGGCRGCRGL